MILREPREQDSVEQDSVRERNSGPLERFHPAWISLLIGVAFFLLLRATPDLPCGYDAYRHVKLASRLITQPAEVFRDPWHLAYFWPKPVDAWFGYHLLLAPFTTVFDLITAVKLLSAIMFGAMAYVLFLLLRHLDARYPAVWVLLALTGSGVTLNRATLTRPFLLAIVLTLLVALFTLKNMPGKVAILSALHAASYSIFFLPAIAPGLWLLLRRDRRSLRIALACAGGIGLGLLVSPYFPENIRYDVFQARVPDVAVRAHVEIGGELDPVKSWWWLATSLPILFLWIPAVAIRVREYWSRSWADPRFLGALCGRPPGQLADEAVGRGPGVPPHSVSIDLLFAASVVTLVATVRVGRTADFFVLFAVLFAAAVLSPRLSRWRKDLPYAAVPLALTCAIYVFLTCQYVLAAPSLARFRGAADYLRTHAPGELVADVQWGDYQFLYFLNTQNRYLVGIEPTMMYRMDPRKYWLWRHISNDETTTCDQEFCEATAQRQDIASAFRTELGTRYVFTEHIANPRLEMILKQTNGVREVYRDDGYSIYHIDF